jgi:hypothetical protein
MSANRAATGVATKLRGYSGPGLTGHRFSTRQRYSPVRRQRGHPRMSTNRASTGVATKLLGYSGLGFNGHRFSTRRRYPQCGNRGGTQG